MGRYGSLAFALLLAPAVLGSRIANPEYMPPNNFIAGAPPDVHDLETSEDETPVSEPGTITLFCTGAVLFWWGSRRHRSRAI